MPTGRSRRRRTGARAPAIFLTHAVLALARAPKSRLVEHAYVVAMGDRPAVDVPDYALDKHTARGREMGRGMSHFYDAGAVVQPAADVDDRTPRGRARSTSAARTSAPARKVSGGDHRLERSSEVVSAAFRL